MGLCLKHGGIARVTCPDGTRESRGSGRRQRRDRAARVGPARRAALAAKCPIRRARQEAPALVGEPSFDEVGWASAAFHICAGGRQARSRRSLAVVRVQGRRSASRAGMHAPFATCVAVRGDFLRRLVPAYATGVPASIIAQRRRCPSNRMASSGSAVAAPRCRRRQQRSARLFRPPFRSRSCSVMAMYVHMCLPQASLKSLEFT